MNKDQLIMKKVKLFKNKYLTIQQIKQKIKIIRIFIFTNQKVIYRLKI
jgi:hypothetical protein